MEESIWGKENARCITDQWTTGHTKPVPQAARFTQTGQQHIILLARISRRGRKECSEETKSIAEFEEPNRVHLYSHKSLTEAVGVPMLSVLKALMGLWRKCSELHCSFFKLCSI
uniref:Uncharacterized protein n=1 Tax=Setaria italica TaxID=4555 RepID=K3ZKD2_SETIT